MKDQDARDQDAKRDAARAARERGHTARGEQAHHWRPRRRAQDEEEEPVTNVAREGEEGLFGAKQAHPAPDDRRAFRR